MLHTGDWKLDHTPYRRQPTVRGAAFRALGDEGVLALDLRFHQRRARRRAARARPTSPRRSRELIADAPHRVAVTTFASNVARIRSVAEAARACGREVVVVGRAMDRVVDVAQRMRLSRRPAGIPHARRLRLPAARQGRRPAHRLARASRAPRWRASRRTSTRTSRCRQATG